MAVVLGVVCDACGARRDEPRAFHFGSARTRSAVHGWVQLEQHGVVRDVCPSCVQAEMATTPATAAASRALVGAASGPVGAAAASRAPRGVVHAAVLVEDDVAMCAWCEAGDCWLCVGHGCECASARHAAAG